MAETPSTSTVEGPAECAARTGSVVPRRPALSPSRAADFKQCPLLYRFRAIDRLPEVPSPAQVRGTLVHAVLERLFALPAAQRVPEVARELVGPVWAELCAAEPRLAAALSGRPCPPAAPSGDARSPEPVGPPPPAAAPVPTAGPIPTAGPGTPCRSAEAASPASLGSPAAAPQQAAPTTNGAPGAAERVAPGSVAAPSGAGAVAEGTGSGSPAADPPSGPVGAELAAWLASTGPLLDAYFALEDPRLLEPEAREVLVEAELDSGLLLRGYVDRIDPVSAGGASSIRVVDYKTGTAPQPAREARALFQMKFYALVLLRLRGRAPTELRLMYLTGPEALSYNPDEAQLHRFGRMLDAMWAAIRTAGATGDFRPNPGPMCAWCSHRTLCPAWDGVPPPYPGWPADPGSADPGSADPESERLEPAAREPAIPGPGTGAPGVSAPGVPEPGPPEPGTPEPAAPAAGTGCVSSGAAPASTGPAP